MHFDAMQAMKIIWQSLDKVQYMTAARDFIDHTDNHTLTINIPL